MNAVACSLLVKAETKFQCPCLSIQVHDYDHFKDL